MTETVSYKGVRLKLATANGPEDVTISKNAAGSLQLRSGDKISMAQYSKALRVELNLADGQLSRLANRKPTNAFDHDGAVPTAAAGTQSRTTMLRRRQTK
jgi:hypothetical protein